MEKYISLEKTEEKSGEEGMIRVLCWDKNRKKEIFDYVQKKHLKRLIKSGYVLALAD